MRRALLLSIWLLVTGCASVPTTETPATTTSIPDSTTTTQAAGTSIAPEAAPCLEGEGDFVTDGVIGLLGAEQGDAERVSAIRWAAHEGCERVVIDLVTADGAPATATGQVQAELRRELGVVRLTLASPISATAVADNAFGGDMAAGAYVVRSLDGPLFVDIHLAGAARARALVLSSPARVVVDLRPGGPGLPQPAPASDRIILLMPRPRSEYGLPLEVAGYGRTFEANVLVRLRQGGELVAETFTTAADWVDTWGAFRTTVSDGPEEGPVTLFVGEESPQDGSEQGVIVELGG